MYAKCNVFVKGKCSNTFVNNYKYEVRSIKKIKFSLSNIDNNQTILNNIKVARNVHYRFQ